MEEEGARKRAARGGANRGFLGGLNEEDEDMEAEDDARAVDEARRRHGEPADKRAGPPLPAQAPVAGAGAREAAKRALQGNAHAQGRANAAVAPNPAYDGRAGQRDRGRRTGKEMFELDMDAATLLARRHKRGGHTGGGMNLAGIGAGGSPLGKVDVSVREVPAGLQDPGSPMRID